MPIKWIVFNGLPECGKSTAARWLCKALEELFRRKGVFKLCHLDSFAAPMKHFLATALSEPYADMNKTKARAELNGYSVREFNIDLAQNYIKQRYGDDAFARWLVYRQLRYIPAPDYVIIDDGGFDVERNALTDPFIVRITGRGSYSNDSRVYWMEPSVIIDNSSGYDHLFLQVSIIARQLADL